MIKTLFFIILLVGFTGCGNEEVSPEATIAKLEADKISLQKDISRLSVQNGKKSVSEMGYFTLTVIISAVIFVLNNIIWLILYKRKK